MPYCQRREQIGSRIPQPVAAAFVCRPAAIRFDHVEELPHREGVQLHTRCAGHARYRVTRAAGRLRGVRRRRARRNPGFWF